MALKFLDPQFFRNQKFLDLKFYKTKKFLGLEDFPWTRAIKYSQDEQSRLNLVLNNKWQMFILMHHNMISSFDKEKFDLSFIIVPQWLAHIPSYIHLISVSSFFWYKDDLFTPIIIFFMVNGGCLFLLFRFGGANTPAFIFIVKLLKEVSCKPSLVHQQKIIGKNNFFSSPCFCLSKI